MPVAMHACRRQRHDVLDHSRARLTQRMALWLTLGEQAVNTQS